MQVGKEGAVREGEAVRGVLSKGFCLPLLPSHWSHPRGPVLAPEREGFPHDHLGLWEEPRF